MSDTENTPAENVETEAPSIEALQAELDKWRGHARTWEDRAKANSDAATKLQEIEDAKKSEIERLAEKADALEADLAAARFDSMRKSIAADYGISKEDTELFLTGDNSEVLKKQAEALKARTSVPVEPPRVGTYVPGLGDRQATESTSREDLARSIFGI